MDRDGYSKCNRCDMLSKNCKCIVEDNGSSNSSSSEDDEGEVVVVYP